MTKAQQGPTLDLVFKRYISVKTFLLLYEKKLMLQVTLILCTSICIFEKVVNVPFLTFCCFNHPQTAHNGEIKCPICGNNFKDVVTVAALSAPQCTLRHQDVVYSTPSSMNPSGGNGLGMTESVKTSISANIHGRSSESDQNDEDLQPHVEAHVRYIL